MPSIEGHLTQEEGVGVGVAGGPDGGDGCAQGPELGGGAVEDQGPGHPHPEHPPLGHRVVGRVEVLLCTPRKSGMRGFGQVFLPNRREGKSSISAI